MLCSGSRDCGDSLTSGLEIRTPYINDLSSPTVITLQPRAHRPLGDETRLQTTWTSHSR